MTSWDRGYVTDVAYFTAYHHDLAPINHYHLCLLHHIQPPPLDRPFVHLDLGCADAFTNVLLAAANPHGQFYAVDFNPTHIATGQHLARRSGVDNIAFLEAGFEDLADLDLPPVDFATSYGVFTWIDPALWPDLVTQIGRLLKPGGTFFTSYNTLPGWLDAIPLQRLLFEYAARHPNPRQRGKAAIAALMKLKNVGGLFFKQNPKAAERLGYLASRDLSYLAHEYLNRHWNPLHQVDMDALLAAAKLTRVGSLQMAGNFPHWLLSPDMAKALELFPDGLQETALDLLLNHGFRRDLYIKGAAVLSPPSQKALLGALRVALAVVPEEVDYATRSPLGPQPLDRQHYQPLVTALADGPLSLEALAQRLDRPWAEVVDGVNRLVDGQQLHLLQPAPLAHVAALERFNAQVLKDPQYHHQTLALAAPEMGAGIATRPLELTLLAAAPDDPDLITHLRGQRLWLTEDGQFPTTSQDQDQIIARFIHQFQRRRRPVFRQLGVV
ncbi:MAG: methyltransferase regulatory domain-containing protein [Candidatus Competibacterales bacterium]